MDDTEEENNEAVISFTNRKSRYRLVRWYRRYIAVPNRCYFTEGVLVSYAIVEALAVSLLVTYLTDVRNQSLVKATITVNLLDFLCSLSALPSAVPYDDGSYPKRIGAVLASAVGYIAGLGLLSLQGVKFFSSSDVLYGALITVALAKASSSSSENLLEDHFKQAQSNNNEETNAYIRKTISATKCKIIGSTLGNALLVVVNNWTIRFGISLSVMCFALFLFLFGTFLYEQEETSTPSNTVSSSDQYVERSNDQLKRTKKYTIAISSTFLMYGIVESIGNTFFLEQGKTMDKGLGRNDVANNSAVVNETLKGMPLNLLLIVMNVSRFSIKQLVEQVFQKRLSGGTKEAIATQIRIGIGLLFSVIICGIAQMVEAKRLSVVKEYDLLDKPDQVVPMSVAWLLPQFIALGAMKGLAGDGLEDFFKDVLPNSRRGRASMFGEAVIGTGTFLGAMLVLILKAATKSGGGPSWFADTTNRSHLDQFYRLLTIMCLLNLFFYAYVSTSYDYKR